MATRRKIAEACVRSQLIYGTETWRPSDSQMAKLEACFAQSLRNMEKGAWVAPQGFTSFTMAIRDIITVIDNCGVTCIFLSEKVIF